MKLRRLVSLTAAAVMFGVTQAWAADAVQVRFATVGVGSSWYNYGAGIAEMVKPLLPEGSSVDVLPIAGGVGNIKLLQQSEAELAIGFPMPAKEGCTGTGSFDMVHDKVRGVLGGLDTYYFGIFVRTDAGVDSMDQIVRGERKVRFLTAKVGGTGETGVRQVLSLYGATKEDLERHGSSVKAMARAATASAIADGQADMWAHVVTKGHPVATQLTTTTDMKMLSLSDEVVKGMVDKYGWVPATIPPNTFKGQTGPIQTVKAASNILARADVPDHVVYAFTKTVVENAGKLPQIHAALSDFDPKQAADPGLVGGCAFHPGAVKYYKEAGMM